MSKTDTFDDNLEALETICTDAEILMANNSAPDVIREKLNELNVFFDKFVSCTDEAVITRSKWEKVDRAKGNAEQVRRKVLSWLECVDLSRDCGAAGESKLEQSANRPGLNLDKDCNNLGDLKEVSASSLNVASKFLSNHKSCKNDKSCEDSDAASSVSSRCSSKSKESRKKFKLAKLSFKLAEEQSYDEGRVAELEARLKTEKLAVKAREAKRKMMFAKAESRAFEDDSSDCSSSKSDISKILSNIAEVLPELEPSKDTCAPSKMFGTNKIASKKFPSNLSDPSTSKIKVRSAEQRTHFGIFDTTHPAEIEPVVVTQPSESRVPVTNRPPEMSIFTNRLSEQYAGTPAVYSQVGKQNSAVAQPHRVTKEKIIANQYPTVVDRLHAPDVAGMSAVTRFFEPNCSSVIARNVVDVGQASHPSGIPHLPPHEVSGTRGPYPPMLPSFADYEHKPTESLYPPGFPQFSRPSYNNTGIPYPPGNLFVPNNVNRNSGRGVPYPPGATPHTLMKIAAPELHTQQEITVFLGLKIILTNFLIRLEFRPLSFRHPLRGS